MKSITTCIFISFLVLNPLVSQTLEKRGVSPDGAIFDMELKGDILYMGGSFDQVGYMTGGIALFHDGDTVPDLGFPRIKGKVYTIIPDGAGGWYAGGDFTQAGLLNRSNVVHILPDMEIDPDFNPEINNTVTSLIIHGERLFMSGLFTTVEGVTRKYLAAWDLSTNALDPMDLSPDRPILDMALYEDKLLVGGQFRQIGDSAFNSLACIDLSSDIVQNFPQISTGQVNVLFLDGHTLYAGGNFSGGALAIDMLTGTITNWNPYVSGFALSARVNAICKRDSVIYLAGAFSNVMNTPRINMAAVSEQGNLLDFAPEPNGEVFSVFIYDNQLYTGGNFDVIAGMDIPHLTRFDAGHQPDTSWCIQPDWAIHSMVATTEGLIVGGLFTMFHAVDCDNACAIDTRTGRITEWVPVSGFLTVSDVKVDVLRDVVYLAGWDANTLRNVKAFDGASGDEINGFDLVFNNSVTAIDQHPETGNLFIAGNFTQLNGQDHSRMAVVDTAGTVLPFNFEADDEITSLVVSEAHGLVYLIGKFNSVNSEARLKAAAVSFDGTLADWNPRPAFTALPGEYTNVNAILVQEDRVFIGGQFDSIGGAYRPCLAAVDPFSGNSLAWNPDLVSKGSFLGSVHLIEKFRNGILVTGAHITEVAGQTFIYLAWIGSVSGQNLNLKEMGYLSVHSIVPQENRLHIGGSFQIIENQYHPFLSSLRFSDAVADDRIEWYSPEEGGNSGDVTLQMIGSGFIEGTRIILRKTGMEDIEAADGSLFVYNGGRVSATFDLRGIPTGPRDIVIEIPGDSTIILTDGFHIVEGMGADPWAEMIAPSNTTRRTNELFYLSYGNSGDADAHGVSIWLAFSPNIEVKEIGFDIIRLMDESDPYYDSIPEYVTIDSLFGKPYEANVYRFIIPKIPAGSSNIIAVKIYGEENGSYYTRAWVDEPMFGSPLKYWVSECEEAIMMKVIGVVPYASCVANSIDLLVSPLLDYFWDPEFGTTDYALNHLELGFSTVLDCVTDLLPTGALKSLAELIQEILNAKSWFDLARACSEQGDDKEDVRGNFISSMDPNDKSGPTGQGETGWLNTNMKFAYLIRFENEPEATAPAKQVVIIDTLQNDVFDLSSLELKGFTIAGNVYKIPSGYSSYATMVDLRPRLPYLVELNADLEMETGALIWKFLTLDPVSMEPVTAPLEGFLPPNSDSISGRGSVFYDVSAFKHLGSGTKITNQAAILFDNNDPIITNEWSLRADNDMPWSQVLQTTDTVYSETVELRWTGGDSGSGIRFYDVKYREDGGNWYTAASQDIDTSIVFSGKPGSMYEFVSIAYDSAMNQEIKPLMTEAMIYFATDPLADEPASIADGIRFNIQPNPVNDQLFIAVEGEVNSVEIKVIEVTGRVVYQEHSVYSKDQHIEMDMSHFRAGLYFLHLQSGSVQKTFKIIKN